ncbi:MAG: O-antigen ligase family protein [Chloroflexota bacterium]
MGLVVATQPPIVTTILFAFVSLLVLTFISPIVALGALLILSPLRTLIATELPVQLPFDIGQITLAVFVIVWLIFNIAQRRPLVRLRYSPLLPPLILFIAIMTINGFVAASFTAWLTEWLKWILIAVLVVTMLTVVPDHGWQWIAFALVSAGLSSALVGLYTFLGGSGAEHLLINNRFFRAFGTFGQPNPFGGFMGLMAMPTAMIALGWLRQLIMIRRQTGRWSFVAGVITLYYGAATTLIILGVFISWSRGAWLGLVAAVIVVLVAMPRKLWQSVIVFTILIAVGAILWSSDRLPTSITDRVESATREIFVLTDVRGVDITANNYAIVERLAHWQASLNMARSNPWFGVGFGNFDAVYPAYNLLNWDMSLGHAHNYYLNVLGETGIIGLAAYLTLFIWVIYQTWQARSHPNVQTRLVIIGLLGTWTYLLVHSLTDNLYVNNLFVHIGVMLGLLASLHREVVGREKVRVR